VSVAPGADAERELADVPRLLESLPRRICDIASLNLARNPAADALREDERAWTYGELAATVDSVAARLDAAGVRPGDRVLIVSENCAALIALLFAVTRQDAWATIVNARLSPREVDSIRAHCTPRRCIYLSHVSESAAAHAARHGASVRLPVGSMGDVTMGAIDPTAQPEDVAVDAPSRVACLIYTSGTTGDPKGVMLTHRNLLFIARVSSTLRALSGDDRIYGVLPISHVYGLASVSLGGLSAGACLQIEPRFSARAMRDALERHGVTVLQGVPSMYAKLVDFARRDPRPLRASRLRCCFAGGAPLDPALKATVERLLGRVLHNGLGLTEASPTVAQTRLWAPRSDCSVGPLLPGLEMRLVDPRGADRRDAAPGEPGELWVRGPSVMRGYYRDADLTARTISSDGWLNTGDIVRRGDDGALFVVGRSKELIIRSGFNVYPVEVESVLNSHPAVTLSAVVGRAVPGNEEVVAFVELASGASATPAEIAVFAATQLAPFKRPCEIVIMPSLPVAANGKVLKHRLSEMARQRPRPDLARTDADCKLSPEESP
jgi:long-chain acyl-CoA synthetase